MIVTIQRTEEVTLSTIQMKEVTIEFLKKEYNLDKNMFVEDGSFMHNVEYDGHRSYTRKEFVRETTEEEIQILNLIKKLS